MKKYLYLAVICILLAVIAFVIFNNRGAQQDLTESDLPFKVVVLLPGSVKDGSWSQSGYEALLRIKKENNIATRYHENVQVKDIPTIVANYAQEKSVFVVGFGGEFSDALEQQASRYPQMKFALVGKYYGNGKNYGSLATKDGAFYLAGVFAAMASKSNVIGIVAGMDLPHIRSASETFESGAKSVNPQIRVLIQYVGAWNDKLESLRIAKDMIGSNVDILMVNVDHANQEVHKYATDMNIKTISVVNSSKSQYPNTVIGSVMNDNYNLLKYGVDLYLQGKWEGKMYNLGMVDGVMYFDYAGKLLTAQQRQAYDEIYTKLVQKRISSSSLME